jgi:hypothetical protein
MTGWTQLGNKVTAVYLGLDPQERENCDIFCYHYGQAGAVMFHGKDDHVPQPISFNGSFVLWSPDSLTKDYMIWVHSDLGNDIDPDSLLPARFETAKMKAVVEDKYFRENGTRIYLCRYPTDDYKKYYKSLIARLKDRYSN